MNECIICGKPRPSQTIPVCPKCAKSHGEVAGSIHERLEIIGGGDCELCSNRCRIEDSGLCNIRFVRNGRIVSRSTSIKAVLHAYQDPLPTNCCNSWFCRGSGMRGYNLAIFYYGCNFDCLYCQNWQHRFVDDAPVISIDKLLEKVMKKEIRCICHFGGSPEPQMSFALKFSELAIEKRGNIAICWEWNGSGNTNLCIRAGELSSKSGGTVKFDIKAWNESLHKILTGRGNRQTLKNLERMFERYPDVVSATTLLVPYYVDSEEVERIAEFISGLSPNIPYSLLVFHPDYRLNDLPITPKNQVLECYRAARRHLKNVNVGNMHLIDRV
ncbi:radical SAM protein [Geoglobus acetivorans]|uniref:Radical SAM protein n=1 Tax=Geoglobus acetivorans TaxID=565033 RepID=A0ABZ3H4V9_GEOAI|nr:radical SAM protein [Geoglobus acetivorans]